MKWIEVPVVVEFNDEPGKTYEVDGSISLDQVLYYFPDADYEYTIVRLNGENLQAKIKYSEFKKLIQDAKE